MIWRILAYASALGCVAVLSVSVFAQEATQVLESPIANTGQAAVELLFNDPTRTQDVASNGIAGSDLRACKRRYNEIFCIDGNSINRWGDAGDPLSKQTLFSCTDATLNFRPGTCRALTVDVGGDIWLAGRFNGSGYGIVRITSSNAGACEAGQLLAGTSAFCAAVFASDNSEFRELEVIESELAEDFPFGAGLLALRPTKEVAFFPFASTPVIWGSRGWNLIGNEVLQDVTVLQLGEDATLENWLLAITDRGRVMARPAVGGASAHEVWDAVAERDPLATTCASGARFSIAASNRTKTVFLSDREVCLASALVDDSASAQFALTRAQEPDLVGGFKDLILSTTVGGQDLPLQSISTSPGIFIDLAECNPCTWFFGQEGKPAVVQNEVQLEDPAKSGMLVFHMLNVLDCRYAPDACVDFFGFSTRQDLLDNGIIVKTDPAADPDLHPESLLQNLKPFFSDDILALFDDSGVPPEGIPDMYVSKQHRGQAPDFRFSVLFARTEEGVRFNDLYELLLDTEALVGDENGCATGFGAATPIATLLDTDTVGIVSERYAGPGGQYRDTQITTGCINPSRLSFGRLSAIVHGTEPTPCAYNEDLAGTWQSDGVCAVGGVETPDDAVFFKWFLSLFDEFEAVASETACAPVDGQATAPLNASQCSDLLSQFDTTTFQLQRCWDAARTPKQSSGAQNCNSFEQQFGFLQDDVAGLTATGEDPGRRVLELRARIQALLFMYEERAKPSIPASGFLEPAS